MIVVLENIQVSYRTGGELLTVLDIPSWYIAEGAQVSIFGPSGCGKSTLLHVVAGLLAPTKGSVVVCGQELTQMGEAKLDHFRAANMGYIFQDFNLLQAYTAAENILLGMTFSHQKPDQHSIKKLLDRVGLSHRSQHHPAELSIGERQRVAIARALACKPKLILADEPTGSLDPVHSHEVVTLLKETCLELGCSLIVVSHDQSVVDAFDSSVSFMELNRAFAPVPPMSNFGGAL